jgi:HTH-type transcriptional regulator/antitoxin HigA
MGRLKLAQVFPPGDFIREELEQRGWRQEDFAKILGWPPSSVSELLAAKRSITVATSKKLEEAFGVPAETWLNLETQYQLARAAAEPAGQVQQRARLYELAPIREMEKRGWIRKTKTVGELQEALKQFFETESLEAPPAIPAAARQSAMAPGQAITPEQTAWCFRARMIAKQLPAKRFTNPAFEAGVSKLRSLMGEPEEARHVPRLLSDMGIRFLLVQHLSRTRIEAATLWLGNAPVVAVSMRYDRIDYFWHTLMHEISHVRHKDAMHVDLDFVKDGKLQARQDTEVERRADAEAAASLIPPEEMRDFILRTRPYYSKERIVGFARRMKVHPGIVAGQLQHREEIDYRANREMLVKVRQIVAPFAPTDGWGQIFAVAE